MKVLLVGVGGVGEAIAVIASRRPWMKQMVLADYNKDRTLEVQAKLGDKSRFPAEWVDASKQQTIEDLIKKYSVDLVMNACDPVYNMPIFEAAYVCGVHYMDMAMSLSSPHPTDPFHKPGVKLGDDQFAQHENWVKKGILALVGLGVEPGMADVFARYAQDHLFDEIEEIGIRDGANLEVKGYEFAPNFSIWTTIEECLNPPVIWEKAKIGLPPPHSPNRKFLNFPAGSGMSNVSTWSTKKFF